MSKHDADLPNGYVTVSTVVMTQGHPLAQQDTVLWEGSLQIVAQGTAVATLMRTPGHDLELVHGFLASEGIATVGGVEVQQQGPSTIAFVDVPAARFASRGTVASSACGVCGRSEVADLTRDIPFVKSSRTVSCAQVLAMAPRMAACQPWFKQTGGAHAAALFDISGALLVVREDVGRHNAVDKVIGWALQREIPGADCLLMVSGRLGFELVQKAARFGVPWLASVSAPSSLAIEVAQSLGVTACGFVRGERLVIYSHPERLSGAAPSPAI